MSRNYGRGVLAPGAESQELTGKNRDYEFGLRTPPLSESQELTGKIRSADSSPRRSPLGAYLGREGGSRGAVFAISQIWARGGADGRPGREGER